MLDYNFCHCIKITNKGKLPLITTAENNIQIDTEKLGKGSQSSIIQIFQNCFSIIARFF